MKLIAIDPGPEKSGFVVIDPITLDILDKGIIANANLITRQDLGFRRRKMFPQDFHHLYLAIEMVNPMDMAVGKSIFETIYWIGRFVEAFNGEYKRITRMEVKLNMCKSAKANDSKVRKACIERLGKPGTKKSPGPTYGIVKDMWQALAVALTYVDHRR